MKAIRRLLVLQHLEREGPGLFEQFAKERDLKIEIIRLDNKNDLPQTKKDDLILIMGGPMGVKDIGRDRCCKTNRRLIAFIRFPLFQLIQNRH